MTTGKNRADQYDIVIAGAGQVGLLCAVTLARYMPHRKIVLIDPRPLVAPDDERAFALAGAARNMLDVLRLWHTLETKANPIERMEVTDSRLADRIRPIFLTFDRPADGGAIAHMVSSRDLIGLLQEAVRASSIEVIEGDRIIGQVPEGSRTEITLASGRVIDSHLLIAADGARSALRDAAGIKLSHWEYDQFGLVCTLVHDKPHHNVAIEHFLPAGPFAILPLRDGENGEHRSSLVWNEGAVETARIVGSEPDDQRGEIQKRFRQQLGSVSQVSTLQSFPLGMALARDYYKDRLVLIGDAVHRVHPIAGQGLNLGFGDVAALAECLMAGERLGLEFGAETQLADYQRWRRFEVTKMGALCDVLNRLFSNDLPGVRLVRDVGLGLVDRAPFIKRALMDQAASNSDSVPKLLRGLEL